MTSSEDVKHDLAIWSNEALVKHLDCIDSCPGQGLGFDVCRKHEGAEFCDSEHYAIVRAALEAADTRLLAAAEAADGWSSVIDSARACRDAGGVCDDCPLEEERESCWYYIHDTDDADVRCIVDLADAVAELRAAIEQRKEGRS